MFDNILEHFVKEVLALAYDAAHVVEYISEVIAESCGFANLFLGHLVTVRRAMARSTPMRSGMKNVLMGVLSLLSSRSAMP